MKKLFFGVFSILAMLPIQAATDVPARITWIQNTNDKHVVMCTKESIAPKYLKKGETGKSVSILEFTFNSLDPGEKATCYVEAYAGTLGPVKSATISAIYDPTVKPKILNFELDPE